MAHLGSLTTLAFRGLYLPRLVTPGRRVHVLRRRVSPLIERKANSRWPELTEDHYIYDTIRITERIKKEPLQLILLEYVEGLGSRGQVVSVPPGLAWRNYILTKKAVYATPENLEKLAAMNSSQLQPLKEDYSSIHLPLLKRNLSKRLLRLFMSPYNSWVIEPWHLRMALRRGYINASLESIQMPTEGKISGPSPDVFNKDFVIGLLVNQKDLLRVRVRLCEWENDPLKRKFTPPGSRPWMDPVPALFEAQAEEVDAMHKEMVHLLIEK